ITPRILLKSCAIPPERRPTASIFCACRNCSSRLFRAVISRFTMTSLPTVPFPLTIALVAHSVFDSSAKTALPRFGGCFEHPRFVLGMDLFERRCDLQFLRAVSENPLVRRTVVEAIAVVIDHRDHIGGIL